MGPLVLSTGEPSLQPFLKSLSLGQPMENPISEGQAITFGGVFSGPPYMSKAFTGSDPPMWEIVNDWGLP